jgi:hypothetical protein
VALISIRVCVPLERALVLGGELNAATLVKRAKEMLTQADEQYAKADKKLQEADDLLDQAKALNAQRAINQVRGAKK